MDAWTTDGRVDGWVGGRTGGRVGRWMDGGWVGNWVLGGWMDGRTGRQVEDKEEENDDDDDDDDDDNDSVLYVSVLSWYEVCYIVRMVVSSTFVYKYSLTVAFS